MASTMNGPRHRFTKKPGTSFTTMTVLPCFKPTDVANAAASLEVPSCVMISSSGILSTGEK